MDGLRLWAQRHAVTPAALAELAYLLAEPAPPPTDPKPRSEAACQAEIRLAAPRLGGVLWRNNCGVFLDDTGVPVRFGLANDSKRLNARVKSADLIGFTPSVVGPQHVGRLVAILTAIECKRADWRWTGSAREVAQQRFLNIVKTGGGIAGFARDADDFHGLVTGGLE